MPPLFTLDQEIRDVAQQAITDLIDNLGKNCLLVYPPIWEPCVNCLYDDIGQKSSNHWRGGGPLPFPNGSVCPSCNGQGLHARETIRTIKLLVSSVPGKFLGGMPLRYQIPDGVITTKGKMADLSDVLQTRKIIVQTELSLAVRMTYELYGEPVDTNNIAQGKFWVATWTRVGA
jgi:hypothetical protein